MSDDCAQGNQKVKIIYSFNKSGYEAQCWEREITAASNSDYTFIPFNHQHFLNPDLYLNSINLDVLYQSSHPGLMDMYRAFREAIDKHQADAIMVNHCPPYHPDFLKTLNVYKVLYSGDDPGATYMRNIPYLHAYDHVMFVAPSYSRDMDMKEKMQYCGMKNADWLPISVFDFEHDAEQSGDSILKHERDIDIIYIGGFFRQKLSMMATLQKTFGTNLRMHGFFRTKHNLYYNMKYGFPGWIKQVSFEERVRLYQRAKIGFNLHWSEYGLGNQRLYHLPANGVMQICDCPNYLDKVFRVGDEVVSFNETNALIDKIKFYLDNDVERNRIAMNGYRRVMNEYRFSTVMNKAGEYIEAGMRRLR